MRDRVAAYCSRWGLLPPGTRVFAGFSGGADSTALLLVLRELGADVTAVHIAHGLRGDAAEADAAWCARFCSDRGIDFRLERLDMAAERRPGESVEMTARRLRLAVWGRLTAGPEPCRVALGHQQDDQIETLLLRLLRGATASGLSGLRPIRTVAGVVLIRPLLAETRAAVEDCLRQAGVTDWRQDASNNSDAHLRNRVRHELVPLLANLGGLAGIARSAELLAADAAWLEAAAAEVDGLTGGRLAAAPMVLRHRLLRAWGDKLGLGDLVLSTGTVAKLNRLLDDGLTGELKRLELGDGRWLVLAKEHLSVADSAGGGASWQPVNWCWRDEPMMHLADGRLLVARAGPAPEWLADCPAERAWFAAAAFPDCLLVRRRLPGDRMMPFGGDGPVRVKKLVSSCGVRTGPVVIEAAALGILWLAPLRRSSLLPASPGEPAVCLELRSEM